MVDVRGLLERVSVALVSGSLMKNSVWVGCVRWGEDGLVIDL